jgi:hypothetical protein
MQRANGGAIGMAPPSFVWIAMGVLIDLWDDELIDRHGSTHVPPHADVHGL